MFLSIFGLDDEFALVLFFHCYSSDLCLYRLAQMSDSKALHHVFLISSN